MSACGKCGVSGPIRRSSFAVDYPPAEAQKCVPRWTRSERAIVLGLGASVAHNDDLAVPLWAADQSIIL